jgi:hypothetical protein
MHRNTYRTKAWCTIVVLGTVMEEIKFSNRTTDHVEVYGPAANVTLWTDSSDILISKPKDKEEARRHWTLKNRKFALRYAVAVSAARGDLCWVSAGFPPGTSEGSDIKMNRAAGLGVAGEHLAVNFWERVGGDGAYRCKDDLQYVTPNRKPTWRQLDPEEKEENTEFSRHRVLVENVFARAKQFSAFQCWRHGRAKHGLMAELVFQLVQLKNRFRPMRSLAGAAAVANFEQVDELMQGIGEQLEVNVLEQRHLHAIEESKRRRREGARRARRRRRGEHTRTHKTRARQTSQCHSFSTTAAHTNKCTQ